jgi:aminocarboxymuconate-semialdehyde decarboxylase
MTVPAIRLLCELVGPDRVVLGSDYPFPIGDPDPVKSVVDTGLAEADRSAILAGNPGQLLAPAR